MNLHLLLAIADLTLLTLLAAIVVLIVILFVLVTWDNLVSRFKKRAQL